MLKAVYANALSTTCCYCAAAVCICIFMRGHSLEFCCRCEHVTWVVLMVSLLNFSVLIGHPLENNLREIKVWQRMRCKGLTEQQHWLPPDLWCVYLTYYLLWLPWELQMVAGRCVLRTHARTHTLWGWAFVSLAGWHRDGTLVSTAHGWMTLQSRADTANTKVEFLGTCMHPNAPRWYSFNEYKLKYN